MSEFIFRSERCFLIPHKRGEILAWKVYLLCILTLILDNLCWPRASGSKQRLSAAVWETFLCKIKMRFSEVFLECPVNTSIESRLKSMRRFLQGACSQSDWSFISTLLQLSIVVINKSVNKLESIPNFLLFFQFPFLSAGRVNFSRASNCVERRIWSTICNSLFWVIYEFATRWRPKN